jgi:dTDP-D-glucose 4,6-dehydratase
MDKREERDTLWLPFPFGANLVFVHKWVICDLVLGNSETKLDFKFDDVQSQTRPQHESLFLDLDSSKAQEELGWRPTWSQTDAILETMDWWKRVLFNGADPREACLKDIRKMLA